MSEKLSIDPITMLERYTPEALKYCSDWAIRNENEKSEKWQKVNQRKLQAMTLSEWDKEKDLQEVKEMRERKKLLRLNKQ